VETYRWSELTRLGHTQDQVRAQMRAGNLVKVRHGVYAPASEVGYAEQHTRLVQATMRGLKPGAVVSHFSAALLHGLPVPAAQLDRVWITRSGERTSRVKGSVRLHRAPLARADCTRVQGLPVTSLARTAVDVACRLDFPTGVAVVDAALARSVARHDLQAVVLSTRGATGIGRAREAVEFGDGRSESVGESRSRALMLQYGVPLPDLQRELHDRDGFIGRVDFWWEQQRVVGEFDGKIKYSRELAPGGDPAEALWLEKRREDRIRRARHGVVRWTWRDLTRPRSWADGLIAALR